MELTNFSSDSQRERALNILKERKTEREIEGERERQIKLERRRKRKDR